MWPSDIDIDRSMKRVGRVERVAGAQVGHPGAPIGACRAGGREGVLDLLSVDCDCLKLGSWQR